MKSVIAIDKDATAHAERTRNLSLASESSGDNTNFVGQMSVNISGRPRSCSSAVGACESRPDGDPSDWFQASAAASEGPTPFLFTHRLFTLPGLSDFSLATAHCVENIHLGRLLGGGKRRLYFAAFFLAPDAGF